MNKTWEHFKLVMTHKKNVYKLCRRVGIPWRGITHDLSKFSPIEFIESVKYYNGERSPIEVCKNINGVSKAWQHHKGRNTHHWQYWLDNTDNGIVGRLMPFEDVLEMLCDQFAAGMTYKKDAWNLDYQLGWWESKTETHQKYMHPVVFMFMDYVYYKTLDFVYDDEFFGYIFNYDVLAELYNWCVMEYEDKGIVK